MATSAARREGSFLCGNWLVPKIALFVWDRTNFRGKVIIVSVKLFNVLCITFSLKSNSGGGDKLATSGVPTRGLLLRAFSIRSQNCIIRLGPDQFSAKGHCSICNRVKFQLPNFIMLGERARPRSPKMVDFWRLSNFRIFGPSELESEAGTVLNRCSDLGKVYVD